MAYTNTKTYRRLACEQALRKRFGSMSWGKMVEEIEKYDKRKHGDAALPWNKRALNNYVGAYLVKDSKGTMRHYNFSTNRLYILSDILGQDIKEMDEIYEYPSIRDCGLDITGNHGSRVKDRDLRVIR